MQLGKEAADLEMKIQIDLAKGVASESGMANKTKLAQIAVERLQCKVEVEKQKLEEIAFSIKRAQAKYDQAKLAKEECTLVAPEAGTLMRVLAHRGETLGAIPRGPALQFVQNGTKIIRAEILQEWAGKVREKQAVEIEDDTSSDPKAAKWKGTIKRLSGWIDKKRSIVLEPFNYNDVRTLECIIQLADSDQNLRIGQRVRVAIRIEP